MNINPQKNYIDKQKKETAFAKLLKPLIFKNKRMLFSFIGDEDQELLESIKNAKNEWINANLNFEYADDQGLVDYYTYRIKACQVRYEYFIKRAKEKGIRVEVLNEEVY